MVLKNRQYFGGLVCEINYLISDVKTMSTLPAMAFE